MDHIANRDNMTCSETFLVNAASQLEINDYTINKRYYSYTLTGSYKGKILSIGCSATYWLSYTGIHNLVPEGVLIKFEPATSLFKGVSKAHAFPKTGIDNFDANYEIYPQALVASQIPREVFQLLAKYIELEIEFNGGSIEANPPRGRKDPMHVADCVEDAQLFSEFLNELLNKY